MKCCTYDLKTGQILACFEVGSINDAYLQAVDGIGVYIGEADERLHRIDIETRERVPQDVSTPPDGAIWIKSERRWMFSAELKEQARRTTLNQIENIESQAIRSIMELLHDPSNKDAKAAFDRLFQQIQGIAVNVRGNSNG